MGIECYRPYVQVTGTSSFVTSRYPHSCHRQNGRLESFFQVEKDGSRTENASQRGEVRLVRTGLSERDEFDRRFAMVPDYELTGSELNTRYPRSAGPAAFCVANAKRGTTSSLCINRSEYMAIVERSRNCDPDRRLLHLLWKSPQLFDGCVRPKPEDSVTETQSKSTVSTTQSKCTTQSKSSTTQSKSTTTKADSKTKTKKLSSGPPLRFDQPVLRLPRVRRQTCPSDCATTNRLVQHRSSCSIDRSTKNKNSGLQCALPPLFTDKCRRVEFRERPSGDARVCCPCQPIDDSSSVSSYDDRPYHCTTRITYPCYNDDTQNVECACAAAASDRTKRCNLFVTTCGCE